MSFSWPSLSFTAAFVAMSAVVSWFEGTFTDTNVRMGFMNHWGMWSDLVLLPIAIGFIVPNAHPNQLTITGAVVLSGIVTVGAHIAWAAWFRSAGITGHLFPHMTGRWYGDLSIAGWMHVVFMAAALAVIFVYVVSPCPNRVVWTLSAILTIHVAVSAIQPGWYCTGILLSARNLIPPAAFAAAIWLIAAVKLAHSRG